MGVCFLFSFVEYDITHCFCLRLPFRHTKPLSLTSSPPGRPYNRNTRVNRLFFLVLWYLCLACLRKLRKWAVVARSITIEMKLRNAEWGVVQPSKPWTWLEPLLFYFFIIPLALYFHFPCSLPLIVSLQLLSLSIAPSTLPLSVPL